MRDYVHGGPIGLLGGAVLLLIAAVICIACSVACAARRNPIVILEGVIGAAEVAAPSLLLLTLLMAWGLGIIGANVPGSPYRIGPFTVGLTAVLSIAAAWMMLAGPRAAQPQIVIPTKARPWREILVIGLVAGGVGTLLIYAPPSLRGTTAPVLAVGTPATSAIQAEANLQKWPVHVVQPGESIAGIAEISNVAATLITVANERFYPSIRATTPPVGSSLLLPNYDLRYSYVGQSIIPNASPRTIVHFTVQLRNDGSTTWVRGTSTEMHIGWPNASEIAPYFTADWLAPDRPGAMTEATVAPGAIATFELNFTVPSSGAFRVRLRPVLEGIAWLDDIGMYAPLAGR